MGILKTTYHKSKGIEKKFKHKAVLFIPTESYDAAAITVVQGLEELGFTIYAIGKPNINSWWCNEVVDNPRGIKFDFALSNMHWGTRWGHYDKYNLRDCLKVLIDGCDNRRKHTWLDKYHFYCGKYKGRIRPQEPILSRDLQPYRWMEPIGDYKPDIVFTSQKNLNDKTFYLPFGIHREYRKLNQGKSGRERSVDFAYIPGSGAGRKKVGECLNRISLPGKVHKGKIRGKARIPSRITHLVERDNNVHSYHRWTQSLIYYGLLNDTKVLISPNVGGSETHWWDSKRPWEAYASGCLCLFEKPRVDMSQYPATELCREAQFDSCDELVEKANWFHGNQGRLEQLRLSAVEGALRYFSPLAIASYFLWKILFEQKGT